MTRVPMLRVWLPALLLLPMMTLPDRGWAGSADGGAARPASVPHADAHTSAATEPAPFVASTAKPFMALMDDAMAVMDRGMRDAPMNGSTDHDFVAMMIPHHQGAVDMAEALLLHTSDPELRNLAQSIIAEQHNEIVLMRAWLNHHGTTLSHPEHRPSAADRALQPEGTSQ